MDGLLVKSKTNTKKEEQAPVILRNYECAEIGNFMTKNQQKDSVVLGCMVCSSDIRHADFPQY